MQCRCFILSRCRRLVALVVSACILVVNSAALAIVAEAQSKDVGQGLKGKATRPTDTASPGSRSDQPQGKRQENLPDSPSLKTPADRPAKSTDDDASHSIQDARELAKSIIEDALNYAHRASPVEYSLLAQVEAATLLWQFDNERALSILNNVCEKLRELKEKDPDKSIHSKQRRLRYLAFYKIARLKPELVSSLALNKSKESVSGEWTEEARAIIQVASEQIASDPALAARLAQQASSLGQVDWAVFLWKMSVSDLRLAEQTAMRVIDNLSDNSLTPIYLLNFSRFPLRPECSAQLKDYYFRALASRLRRNFSQNLPTEELSSDVVTTREALRLAHAYPRWREEFAAIALALNESLSARSVVAHQPATLHISMSPEVEQGETKEIADQTPIVERIKQADARDLRYQQLAAAASLKADLLLAEELMGKIEDNDIRRETSLKVYGPYVTQAIRDSNWAKGREHALKIADPLGRTLALIRIAQSMTSSNQDKQAIKDVYALAAKRLQKESLTEYAARAFFILSKSLPPAYVDESLEAVNWGIYVANKVVRNGESFSDLKVSAEIAPWISLPRFSLHDEALDLTEIIGPIFEAMAKRDPQNALSISSRFNHLGLYSLAQLGIARALLQKSDIKQKVGDRHAPAPNPANRPR